MDGVLVIRKEKGYTSHDVVAKLRGILHMKKIGHTGTLDPDAEGVLPVVLGRATKLVDLLTEKRKTYEALLHLGIETDTQDMTGTVLNEKPVTVSEEEVKAVIESFLGEQEQIPPMYSALKVNGKKLYELAREGKTVERKTRPVCFYEIEILEMDLRWYVFLLHAARELISGLCAMILDRNWAAVPAWKSLPVQHPVSIAGKTASHWMKYRKKWKKESLRRGFFLFQKCSRLIRRSAAINSETGFF